MDATHHSLDQAIISRYAGQPTRLPAELRARIEASWSGAPVLLYALADLNPRLELTECWVAIGGEQVAVAKGADGGRADWEISSFPRARVTAVRESPGLSATTLAFLGAPDEPALAVVRYTHRQRRAFENLKCVVEEGQRGGGAEGQRGSDELYAEAVARPVRDAQALVAGKPHAVIARLLGYLTPYRRQLGLGMGAATLITLVSLIPPWLAGYVLDRLVVPARGGTLPLERAALLAWIAVSAMALVFLVRQAAAWIRLRLMAIMGEWVARDLRTELYEHLQELSLAFFSRKKTGSIITRVSADTDRLWEFVAFGVVDVSLSCVMLIGLGTVLVTLDWRLGLAMVLPVPLFCWLIFRHG